MITSQRARMSAGEQACTGKAGMRQARAARKASCVIGSEKSDKSFSVAPRRSSAPGVAVRSVSVTTR